MNEQNRYRGNSSQRRSNEGQGSSWQGENESSSANRGQWQRGGGASDRLTENPWQGEGYGQRGGSREDQYGDRNQFDRNQFDRGRGQYGSSNPDFARDNEFNRDRNYSEQYGDYGGSSEYGTQERSGLGGQSYGGRSQSSDRQYRGGSGSYGSGSYGSGSYGSGSYGSGAAIGAGSSMGSGSYGSGSSSGTRSGAIANFGSRTRSDSGYYSGGQAQSFYGRGPKGYARSDERIREDVCERLSENDEVDASDIEVAVSDRKVTLTGSVENRRMKHIAEDISEAVSGVDDVDNRITVRKAFLQDMKDQIMGSEPPAHHANGGTKSTSGSSSSSSELQSGNGRV